MVSFPCNLILVFSNCFCQLLATSLLACVCVVFSVDRDRVRVEVGVSEGRVLAAFSDYEMLENCQSEPSPDQDKYLAV